jgi:hypothetical protein
MGLLLFALSLLLRLWYDTSLLLILSILFMRIPNTFINLIERAYDRLDEIPCRVNSHIAAYALGKYVDNLVLDIRSIFTFKKKVGT